MKAWEWGVIKKKREEEKVGGGSEDGREQESVGGRSKRVLLLLLLVLARFLVFNLLLSTSTSLAPSLSSPHHNHSLSPPQTFCFSGIHPSIYLSILPILLFILHAFSFSSSPFRSKLEISSKNKVPSHSTLPFFVSFTNMILTSNSLSTTFSFFLLFAHTFSLHFFLQCFQSGYTRYLFI